MKWKRMEVLSSTTIFWKVVKENVCVGACPCISKTTSTPDWNLTMLPWFTWSYVRPFPNVSLIPYYVHILKEKGANFDSRKPKYQIPWHFHDFSLTLQADSRVYAIFFSSKKHGWRQKFIRQMNLLWLMIKRKLWFLTIFHDISRILPIFLKFHDISMSILLIFGIPWHFQVFQVFQTRGDPSHGKLFSTMCKCWKYPRINLKNYLNHVYIWQKSYVHETDRSKSHLVLSRALFWLSTLSRMPW